MWLTVTFIYYLLSEYEITSTRDQRPQTDEKITPKTIEEYEEQEAKEAEEFSRAGVAITDRKVPEYTINYQQSVSAEDVFLQVSKLFIFCIM